MLRPAERTSSSYGLVLVTVKTCWSFWNLNKMIPVKQKLILSSGSGFYWEQQLMSVSDGNWRLEQRRYWNGLYCGNRRRRCVSRKNKDSDSTTTQWRLLQLVLCHSEATTSALHNTNTFTTHSSGFTICPESFQFLEAAETNRLNHSKEFSSSMSPPAASVSQVSTSRFSPSLRDVSWRTSARPPKASWTWRTSARPSSGVLDLEDVEDGEAAVDLAAVLRLQAVGDALLHLLAAAQEAAAVPSQLLPGTPPVLLLLTAAGEELLHIVTETNLTRRRRVWVGHTSASSPENRQRLKLKPALSLKLESVNHAAAVFKSSI